MALDNLIDPLATTLFKLFDPEETFGYRKVGKSYKLNVYLVV